MRTRLMQINDDLILEVTKDEPAKFHISEKKELARKAYLEAAISKFQAQLDECNAQLSMIYAAEKQ